MLQYWQLVLSNTLQLSILGTSGHWDICFVQIGQIESKFNLELYYISIYNIILLIS